MHHPQARANTPRYSSVYAHHFLEARYEARILGAIDDDTIIYEKYATLKPILRVIPHGSWLVPPQSEQLLYSAYNMDWLQLDTRHRRSLLIFMERVKRPVHTMAGTIIPLSAGTFLSVNHTSISVNPKHIHHIDKFLDACII
ncbi:unnamed protein product [Plutella xylostella]|uniref:(diamondback moth) hypothetical protein n=1 Tax=Plutella xylostella TaxID=51655 RepID=A0A8S4G562_PLUXY|nr:unnamed protein product [Plutella xylostella]